MSNEPHWLTDEEIENELQTCELLFGVCGLNGKWYFSDRELERVNGPYDSYHECVKSCLDHFENDPHWLSDEEMSKLPGDQKILSDATTKLNGKWYFYNETYSQLKGPYQTREDAQKAQEKYENTL